MEPTSLGKRISAHRKRLGLTQEQLAERIGVTPQAVSKWENNLSCPDISLLPELAEIFGVSIDDLLGRNAPPRAYEAEVVENTGHADKTDKVKKSIRKRISRVTHYSGLWFAVYILLIGALLLLRNFVETEVTVWSVLWKTAVLTIGLSCLVHKFSFFSIVLSLTGVYLLLENFKLLPFTLGRGVILPLILLIWGVSLFLDVLSRHHRHTYYVNDSPENEKQRKEKRSYACADGYLNCDLAFGSSRTAVVATLLRGGEIDSSFGDFVVDFSGCEALAENCTIDIDHSFGSLTLLVPDRFAVGFLHEDHAAGGKTIKGSPIEHPQGTLHLKTDVSFGTLVIRYVS
ncbi:MAG: helix-turn-helix domain-containing protein [Oscillospiraceae bacterium]|jgi:transcriptional regulator with XRE-family HTH domain|nr:helix-turn-helix domain-containing protein [Oscillospiraceae bacterium]